MAKLPPQEANITLADFINYAKFQICQERSILMKAPVWENYTDEEILAEYYAIYYYKNKNELTAFESQLEGEDPDLMDWFTKMEKENQKDIEKMLKNQPETLSLNPAEILGE